MVTTQSFSAFLTSYNLCHDYIVNTSCVIYSFCKCICVCVRAVVTRRLRRRGDVKFLRRLIKNIYKISDQIDFRSTLPLDEGAVTCLSIHASDQILENGQRPG